MISNVINIDTYVYVLSHWRNYLMTKNPSLRPSMELLSIGNVISAGLRIYRHHFKTYLLLALKALFWSLIPVYGWAKNYQIQAIISRQAYKELLNQPESVSTTRTQLNYRFWDFWIAQILIGLIVTGVYISLTIVSSFIVSIPLDIVHASVVDASNPNPGVSLMINSIQLLLGFCVFMICIWFYSHFFLAELPLVVENKMDSTTCLGRSWELTKGLVIRVQIIALLAALITAPIVLLTLSPVFFLNSVISASSSTDVILSTAFLMGVLGVVLSVIGSTLMMPFWQAIKAVIYYEIRTRREGLGAKTRKSRSR